MRLKSDPYRIFLAANRRVWKAIRTGDLNAAERWTRIADRQRAMTGRSGAESDRHERNRVWIEERNLRTEGLRKWGK